MKVGILKSSSPPTEGGGFTFEDDIFMALLELANQSKHNFILFSHNFPEQTRPMAFDNLQLVSLRSSFTKRAVVKLYRIGSGVAKNIRHARLPLHIISRFEQQALAAGIEFVWYLSAGGAGAIDLPYAVPVWDLQHRVQPWFPELSADGKWDAREMYWARCLGRASIVICGTEAGKREIMDLYHVPPDRIKFLPHPTPRFALDNAQSLGDDTSSYVLGRYNLPKGYLFYPAQFWAHKNHIGVLLAVYLLRERYGIEFPVVFIGSDKGNLRYVKQEIEKLNLNDQVHFLGFVPQKDVVGLYHNAFALTYLSFFGPENLPPLEAFALGCPVIASKVPGAEEQLGNAAMLVDPKSPEQITDAIKRLHEDPLLRQALIEGGVKRALKFTGQDFVKGMFSILDEFESIRRTWSAG